MIYQTNVSDIIPGKMAEYDAIVTKEILPLMKKHGMNLVAAWSGHTGNVNKVYAVYSYADMAQGEKILASLQQDPEYQKVNVRLNALRTKQERGYLDARPWSPTK